MASHDQPLEIHVHCGCGPKLDELLCLAREERRHDADVGRKLVEIADALGGNSDEAAKLRALAARLNAVGTPPAT